MKKAVKSNKLIYLIRHGETDWNVEGRAQGFEADIPLNDNGINQSQITGSYLKNYRVKNKIFDAIFSSPMKRAHETASIIGGILGTNIKIILLENLAETRSGLLSGVTKEERLKDPQFNSYNITSKNIEQIKDPIEKVYAKYKFNEQLVKEYNVEPYREIYIKCKEIMNDILSSPYRKIIIVSHSALINRLLSYITRSAYPCYGDMTNGSNCAICYIKYIDGEYFVVTQPNTLHLAFSQLSP